ncbi:hypothetical protein DIURU_000003 [Diutina rugosa]|uniref:Major facilitator superfamily (MFS) profile domain-containing protein n=1 Tax=Diutina rugosa TaxID=5481 RepID=A0A642UZS4_DIURU|nr:uncharacterized protein DIURU_000003 [Diutina rugosa]KAA8908690.1 hypothetical protein DIURU_000003 [Diutina rugosa]
MPPTHPNMSLTPTLVTTVAIICLGSLQFGYHMAELNSPEQILSCQRSEPVPGLPYKDTWFGSHGYARCLDMSTEQVGMATSIFSIGGLLGSIYVGSLADKVGRWRVSVGQTLIYLLGSLVAGLANTYYQLLAGRLLSGIAAGSALVITAIYINEIAPTSAKGLLGSMNQVSINVGILLTQSLALIWCNNNQWRLLLLMGCVVAGVNCLLILAYIPESPVWLEANNRGPEAMTVLHRIRGGDYESIRTEVSSWRSQDDNLLGGASNQKTVGIRDYLRLPQYRNSRVVATGILVLQQFDGINSIIFYGVGVLTSIFSNAIAINCVIALVNVIVTFGAAQWVDKLGRKPLLLLSVSMLGVASAIMAFGIMWSSAILSVVGMFTYIAFFAVGLGPIPFLLVGEVTQPQAKATAQSWGTSMNWVATFIVGYSFPLLMKAMGGAVYFIFVGMCAFSYWFIKTKVPETKGKKSYEEVWGIQ